MGRIRSVPTNSARWATAFIAFVVLTATSGVAFALVVLVTGALAMAAWVNLRGLDNRRRVGARSALLVASLGLVSVGGHLLAPTTSPAHPLALSAGPPPGASASQIASVLVQQLPDRSTSWLLLGDTGDSTTVLSSGYLGYERALLLDSHQVRAALGLAQLYVSRDQSLLDVEIADFYTLLAGYHAPALRPAS